MELTVINQQGQESTISLKDLLAQLAEQASQLGENNFQSAVILEKAGKYLQIFQMGPQKTISSSQLSELIASICREEGYSKLAGDLHKHSNDNFLPSQNKNQLNFGRSAQEKLKKIYLPALAQNLDINNLIQRLASANSPHQLAASIEALINQGKFIPHQNILKAKRPFSSMYIHLQDNLGDIFDQLKQVAINFQNLISTTISFSAIRPKMSIIKSTQGFSSGPVSFIKIYTSTFEALRQNLSADFTPLQTFILNIHHPDILEFLIFIKNFQKNSLNKHLEFLIELSPAFLEALSKEEDFELINPESGQAINLLSAKNTFDLIVSTILENPALGLSNFPPLNSENQLFLEGLINLAPYSNLKDLLEDLPAIEKYLQNQLENLKDQADLNKQIKLLITGWNDFLIGQKLAFNSIASLEMADQVFAAIRTALKPQIQLGVDLHTPLLIAFETGRGLECLDQLATQRTNLDGQEIYQLAPALKEELNSLGLISNELIKQIFESNSLTDFYQIPVQIKNLFQTAKEISPDFHLELQRLLEKRLGGQIEKKIYFGSVLDLEKIKATMIRELDQGIHVIRLCQFETPGKNDSATENNHDRNFLHSLSKNRKKRHREIQPPLFQIKKTEEIALPPISS